MPGHHLNNDISDALLASVVFFAEDSIIITSKELDPPDPAIIYVNPGFTKMTGYASQEVIGKTPRILQGAKTDRNVIARLRSTLEKGEVFFGQAINYRKDGSEFWNEWHIEPIRNEAGAITHYVAIQRDITERKKNELAIVQKNAALKEILEHIEIEKRNIAHNVQLNVEEVLLPVLKKMRRKGTALDKVYLGVLEKNLKDLTLSFGASVSQKRFKLSPREIEIANLIKNGIGSKEIAAMLNVSFKTVETHRNKIRKKLDILNKNINLTTYLQTV